MKTLIVVQQQTDLCDRFKFQEDSTIETVEKKDYQGRYRFYLECLPHGSLERLRLRHKAWRQPVPELFVWCAFKKLAWALLVLSDGPKTSLYTPGNIRPKDWGIVHFDIKLDNICLGYSDERPDAEWFDQEYPDVKLVDFGLAADTGRLDHENPSNQWWRGTPGFFPPEAHEWDDDTGIFGLNFRHPPNGNRLNTSSQDRVRLWRNDPGVTFDSSHNVWVLGKYNDQLDSSGANDH